jgi:hypothetical protein
MIAGTAITLVDIARLTFVSGGERLRSVDA